MLACNAGLRAQHKKSSPSSASAKAAASALAAAPANAPAAVELHGGSNMIVPLHPEEPAIFDLIALPDGVLGLEDQQFDLEFQGWDAAFENE
jgi:hypothetical protein